MPDIKQISELVQLGREERFLEYKASAAWPDLKAKIIRSAMAMANIRDGGTIVIGVSQKDGHFLADGVSPDHLVSYDVDDMQAAINRHADPYVRIELHRVEIKKVGIFLAVVVQEFDELPVVCKKDGTDLRQGAIYSRSFRMPESSEIRSQTEMREILELATDKAVKTFVQRIQAAGVRLGEGTESDSERFNKQLGGL